MKLFKRKSMLGKFMDLIPKVYKEYMSLLRIKNGPLFMYKDGPNGKIMVIIGIGNRKNFIMDVREKLNMIVIK